MMLVMRRMIAMMPRTIANTPFITPVKHKIPITTATIARMIRSSVPMFCFILFLLFRFIDIISLP